VGKKNIKKMNNIKVIKHTTIYEFEATVQDYLNEGYTINSTHIYQESK
jgi:hypothetical protein